MGRRWKPSIRNHTYRGIGLNVSLKGAPDERGLYDLRPMRFEPLRGASALQILTELVNLPDDGSALEVKQFTEKFHNLALGGTSSGGRNSRPMSAQEIIRLRGLFRQFWETRSGPYRSMLFMRLIGPWLEARNSAIADKDLPSRADDVDLFPMLDYNSSALQLDWTTGQFRIVARGPLDWLTHAIFQNRNRLRTCTKCSHLFVGFGPNEKTCSQPCKLDAERSRKRKSWHKKHPGGKKRKKRSLRGS